MSLTCGFFNSIEHDRRYDARQFSRIFDGIINDGIFMNIGDCMIVKSTTGRNVEIGTGRAWFDGTWSYNDTAYLLELPLSDTITKRIDTIVLEVNYADSVRANSYKVLRGEASDEPVPPTLINDELVHQHPLCNIARQPNVDDVTQADITNLVGTEVTPFVSGILETVNTSELLIQWEAQFAQWMGRLVDDFEDWSSKEKNDFADWLQERYDEFDALIKDADDDLSAWYTANEATFQTWLNGLQTDLGEDAAGNLWVNISNEELKRIMTAGFDDGVKTISRDGRQITTVASDGRVLEKVFNQDFSELTTTLKSKEGAVVARQIKTFDSSGSVITTETTYLY